MQATQLIRPQLLEQLNQGAGCIYVLCAPPGSGKTSLLYQHYQQLQSQQRPVYWLNLSAQDNAPDVLQQHLAAAWQGAHHAALGCGAAPSHLHLFLDGLELLTDPPALALAMQQLLSLPCDATAYTTAHQLHHPSLHDARMRGVLRVLDAQQLRLSDAEAATVLGPQWPPELASQLNQRMQGWVAGLRLLQHTPAAAQQWLADTQCQRLLPTALADYFENMLCRHMRADLLHTLMELSTLEHFRAELYADLPAPPCAWADIEHLLHCGWFLQQVPYAPTWLHVQPALGQYLRQRLQRYAPQRYLELRHFAAQWHAQQGYGKEAVRHAVQLGTAQAPFIVEQAGAIAIDLGEGPDVMLEPALPPQRAAELPLLYLGQIYHRFRHGRVQEARHMFDAANALTQHFTHIHSQHLHSEVRGWHCLLHLVLLNTEDLPIAPEHQAQLHREYCLQSSRNPTLAASLASVMAFIWLNEGQFIQAASICSQALRLHASDSTVKVRLFLRLHQASAALAQSPLEQALEALQDGMQLAQHTCAPDSYEINCLRLLQAIVHFERNDTHTAHSLLQRSLPHMHGAFGWTRLYSDVFATAVQLAVQRSERTAAEHLLHQGEQLAHERQLPRLLECLRITRLRMLTQCGDWVEALALLESPALRALLQPSGHTPYPHSTQVPALLAAAQLYLDLGRTNAALQALRTLPQHWMHTAEQRQHFHFHVLQMRAAYVLHHYKVAAQHWQNAVQLARLAGLLGLVWQERAHLLHLMQALPRTRRSPLAESLQHWLQQVLQADEAARPGLPPTPPSKPDPVAKRLSPRESEILTLMARGLISKEIAQQLGISEGTVKTHRKHIHEKLGVRTRSQALQKAHEWLLI